MHPLHIALHEGFRDSTVTITAGGKEVFRKSGVTTDLSISRADAVDIQTDAKATVNVTVNPGGIKGSIALDTTTYPFLAVSVKVARSNSSRRRNCSTARSLARRALFDGLPATGPRPSRQ